jgi:2-keto-4-pentenoate hydratase/2-oxohepta-3-ene-1,7-dioic acid hydratase in catechol pathway
MRLARVAVGHQIMGVVVAGADIGVRLDVQGDDPLLELVRSPDGLRSAAEAAMANRADEVDLAAAVWLSPLKRPGKIVAVGLNYPDHTAETGIEPPSAPLTFAKYASSLTGPYSDIEIPAAVTDQVDYEAELAVVIGRDCPPDGSAGLDAIAAYTVANDVSARDVQFADRQWTRAKSFDTFTPLGPWLVTADQVADLAARRIWTSIGEQTLQDDVIGSMVFDIAAILGHLSVGTSLEAGDLILTGTPSGAGAFREPPRFLRPGDVVEVGVEGVGVLRNPVRSSSAR